MELFVLMLILLNPFSQILYLRELLTSMSLRDFANVHVRASLLSFAVFAIFVIFGDPLLRDVFQVRLASLQIFGGFINLFIAYKFITQGEGSNLLFRGNIADLAPTIALPYTVGPGTLWTSILMGHRYSPFIGFAMIGGVLLINTAVLLCAKYLFDHVSGRGGTMLGKYFAVLMRTMALLVGGVGVEMILTGIESAFHLASAGSGAMGVAP